MSGLNHEAFRKEKYELSAVGVATKVSGIWELPTDMFKNKAVVLSGQKGTDMPTTIKGRVYEHDGNYHACTYTLNRQGRRSAWTNKGNDVDVVDVIAGNAIGFVQGCDLFPRTALFHYFIRQPNGNWNIRPIERTGNLWYLISDNKKKICDRLVADDFNNMFMYKAFISKHLSPFAMAEPVNVLIPGKKVNGVWNPLDSEDLALLNTSTAYVFNQISDAVNQNLTSFLKDTINIYGKLYKQNFSYGNFLVLSSASGTNPCAAYIDLRNIERSRLVIDQTLYWHLTETEDEAIYLSGLINSTALWEAISDFQPEGGFGKRHIHTLPYKIIPQFDAYNDAHKNVIEITKSLINEWREVCRIEQYNKLLEPNSGALPSRRKRQQSKIQKLPSYELYTMACSCVIG